MEAGTREVEVRGKVSAAAPEGGRSRAEEMNRSFSVAAGAAAEDASFWWGRTAEDLEV